MRLKEIAKQKGISGSELARRMGVSPAYINQAFQGKVNLSISKCEEFAKVLDVPMASLFDGWHDPDVTFCPHCGKPIKLVKE
jgi:transcriptional regulator with XRE-family HTH domain